MPARIAHTLASTLGAALVLSALAPLARAQSADVVLPPPSSQAEQNSAMFWFLSPFESRQQLVIDASALRGFEGRRISAIQVRRSADSSQVLDAGHLDIRVSLTSGVAPAAITSDFAANRTAAPTLVFDKLLFVPSAPVSPKAPADWQRPFMVELPLQTAYTYQGGALVIESETAPVRPQARNPLPTPWWPIDAQRDSSLDGQVQSLGSSCLPGFDAEAACCDAATLRLGSTSVHTLLGPATAQLAFFALGFQETAIPLDAFGAPGCTAYVLADGFVPSAFEALPPGRHAQAKVQVQIPNNRALVNARFVTQWIVPTPKSNTLGLSLSNGVACTLGAAHSPAFAMVSAASASASSGGVRFDKIPVVRIVFAPPQ